MIARKRGTDQIARGILCCLPGWLLLLGLVAPALAQTPTAGNQPPALGERIERLRRTVEVGTGLDEAQRREAQAQLDRTTEAEREAEARRAEAAQLRRLQSEGEARSTRLERSLAQSTDPGLETLTREMERLGSESQLLRRLDSERSALAQASAELERIDAELLAVAGRPLALSEELAAQRRRLEELRAAALAERADERAPPALQLRRLEADAAWRLAAAQFEALEAEQSSLPLRRRLLELEQQGQQRSVAALEARVALLAERARASTGAQVEALRQRLAADVESFAGAPRPLREAAEANLALGGDFARWSNDVESLTRRTREAGQASRDAEAALRAVQARLAFAGAQDGLGLMLSDIRRRLESPARLQRLLDDTRQQLASARLRSIELGEARRALEQRERQIDQTVQRLDLDSEEEAATLREGLIHLLAVRAEILPQLETAKLARIEALGELERSLQQQWRTTQQLAALLDRHLLWTPSHEPMDLAWLQRLPEGLADLAKPSRYQTSASLAWRQIEARPLTALLLLVLIGVGFLLRRQAPARLDALSQPLRQIRSDSYRHTAQALATTLPAALPWALAFWSLGWLLQQAGEPGRFSDSLGQAAQALSGGILIAEALHWLSLERGLGHAHFRWPRARRQAIRAALPWIVFGLLPLQFVLALSFVRGQEPALDTAARLALVGFCVLGAWLAWRLLAPGAVWTSRSREVAEPILLRRLLRLALAAFLLACALLAIGGYLLTAGVLLRALWASLGVVLGVALLQGLIARWFLLGERRLAARRLAERRAAEAEAGAGGEGSEADEPLPDIEPEEIALASINAQTRRLLRALVFTLLALGLFAIWSEMLPAFERLKEIALWEFATLDEQGNPAKGTVSLSDLLLGLLVLLLTFIAARNLPALVEIGLLSRIRIDAPTRYAITSVSRYLIVIVGAIAGLSLLGLRWSQLQWMAAALTVGLGFGLQEIFANFVSGLILLFERPFRVGDVITIGDQTGTVSRIRTRATTLVDFDGKEIVVPNKTFITDRLVNWTLTDTRTRVIIKVGVAYGTKPDRVHALLAQAAAGHPQVLADPPPRTWFMAFGASSLDFELRVFVDSIQDRLRVQNDLNGRIAELFESEGIEIAFPQLDLHVRDVPIPPAARAPEDPR
jgi:potassium-dependent mechanosensitive channel